MPAASATGIDTAYLTMAATAVPDIVALSATQSDDGIVDLPLGGGAAFAVATANLGIAAPITLGSGINAGWALAIDAGSNVFAVGNSAVYEVPAGFATNRKLAGNFQDAFGIAVDGSGNLFVSDYSANTVNIILAVDGAIPESPQIVTIGSGVQELPVGGTLQPVGNFIGAVGLAFDQAGSVTELTAASHFTGTIPVTASIDMPQAIAADAEDNLYVTDISGSVKKMLASTGYTQIFAYGSGFSTESFGIALDTSGNIYVSDAVNHAVTELTVADGYGTSRVLSSDFTQPDGIAVDTAGNVFVADPGAPAVKEILAVDGSIPPQPAIQTLGSGFVGPTGTQNTPVPIAGNGGSQSFLLSFSSYLSQPFAETGLQLSFGCSQGPNPTTISYAAIVPGVDTVDLSMSATPVPDIIALAATPTGNGVVEIPSGGSAANAAPTFSIFAQASGAMPFAPATSRLFVRFVDSSGGTHGSTSVAVDTK